MTEIIYSPMEVELIDYMGIDATTVADTARASFGRKAQDFSSEQNNKLVNYLAKHNHWTPMCSLQASLRIKLPLSIHAQLVTHKQGGTINTMSRRYVRDKIEFYKPIWRESPTNGIKQGSGDISNEQEVANIIHRGALTNSLTAYENLLACGYAPEQCRGVLPVDLMTTCVVVGSSYYFARMYKQRSAPNAQKEWKDLTDKMDNIFSLLWPTTWSALKGEPNG